MKSDRSPELRRSFDFDCPSCKGRLRVEVSDRARLLACPHCDTVVPGPVFRQYAHDAVRPLMRVEFEARCPECGRPRNSSTKEINTLVLCPGCGDTWPVDPPDWAERFHAVAQVLTAEDLRRSVHHSMFTNDRLVLDDSQIPEAGRTRFKFYCGECGVLHPARVWDIACQRKCSRCRTRMIIPSPPFRLNGHSLVGNTMSRRQRQPGTRVGPLLFCPRCGRQTQGSDPTLSRPSRCGACLLWF